MRIWISMVLVAVCSIVSGESKDFQLPEICGLGTTLREKCVVNTGDPDCANCIVGNYLSKFCSELKPDPTVEPDCEKILACITPLDIQCWTRIFVWLINLIWKFVYFITHLQRESASRLKSFFPTKLYISCFRPKRKISLLSKNVKCKKNFAKFDNKINICLFSIKAKNAGEVFSFWILRKIP